MAQFDVYANPSSKTRKHYPYLVDIQNPILESISTRVVIPLGKSQTFKHETIEHLTPVIKYHAEEYLLLTLQLASIPKSLLKNPIGNIDAMRNDIVAALDFLVTGI